MDLLIFGTRECRKYVTLGKSTAKGLNAFLSKPEIKKQIEWYEKIAVGMINTGEPITLFNLNIHLGIAPKEKKETAETKSFANKACIDVFTDILAEEKGLSERTRRRKSCVLSAMVEYGKIKTLADLTPENLRLFDEWLHDDGKRTDVTVYGYHKNLKKWCRLAYEKELIPESPYNKVHFTKGVSKERKPLLQSELDLLVNMELKGRFDRARDLFVFAAHTGMAYCDVQAFDFGTMTEEINGIFYIDGSRIKTKTNFYTPILGPAMRVLEKYGFELPKMSNQKCNDYLAEIAFAARINKPVTFHIARHTFATLALANEIPIANVARMLGHKSINTTQIYAKILKENIAKHAERWTSVLDAHNEKNCARRRVTKDETSKVLNPEINAPRRKSTTIKTTIPTEVPQQTNINLNQFKPQPSQTPQPDVQPTVQPSYQPSYPTYPEYSGYSMPSFSYSYV